MSSVPSLQHNGRETLDDFLKESVARKHIPALFLGATNVDKTIYLNQAGLLKFDDPSSGEVNEDTVTECFSQTKLVTCIAALQLVDRGLVSLDSEADIEKHLPELGDLPVLKGYKEDDTPILEKAEKKITLRMLMSHSAAGFIYPHSPSPLSKWVTANPIPSCLSPNFSASSILQPLLYNPGTSWVYSTSIDIVGLLIQRITSTRLDTFIQENIFTPLNIHDMTFYPNPSVLSKKMTTCERNSKGEVVVIPSGFGMSRPTNSENISKDLPSGGAGLYGPQKSYLTFLRGLLQSSPSYISTHKSHTPLISTTSFNELFTPSVKTQKGREGIIEQVSKPGYFPGLAVDNVDHSVGFLINLVGFEGRRSKGSGAWSGAAKTQFWIDPERGLAGICGTQLLSPSPDPFFATFVEYERLLYANLA